MKGLGTGVFLIAFGLTAFSAATFAKKPKDVFEAPRNENPVGDATHSFERKTHTAPGPKENHVLTYFWKAPEPPYPDGLTFPLVLILHGAPGNAYAGQYLVSPEMQVKYPAFILIPVLPPKTTWAIPQYGPNSPVKKTFAYERAAMDDVVHLIATLQTQYPIDAKRIYVLGCSEGGYGSFGAVLNYPEFFAAAVPMSGGWNPEDAPRMTKVPIWAFHGRMDDTVPVQETRDMVSLIQQYRGTIYYTEFPDMAHDCAAPKLYSEQMWTWLFSQKK